MRLIKLDVTLLLALTVVACGSNSTSSNSSITPSPTISSLPTPSAVPLGITVTNKGALGKVLSNSSGFTLYYFVPDAAGTPTCVAACAILWPPVTLNPGAITSTDLQATGTFGRVHRSDGTIQVTYNSWPLYTYSKDTTPVSALGEGVGGKWHAAKLSTAAPAGTSATAAPMAKPSIAATYTPYSPY